MSERSKKITRRSLLIGAAILGGGKLLVDALPVPSVEAGFTGGVRVDTANVLAGCDVHRAKVPDGKVRGWVALQGHRWWGHTSEQIALPVEQTFRVSRMIDDPSTGALNVVKLDSGQTQNRGTWKGDQGQNLGDKKIFEGPADGVTEYPCTDGGTVKLESMQVRTEIFIDGVPVETNPNSFPVPDLGEGGDVDFKGFPTPTPQATATATPTAAAIPTLTPTTAPAPGQYPK